MDVCSKSCFTENIANLNAKPQVVYLNRWKDSSKWPQNNHKTIWNVHNSRFIHTKARVQKHTRTHMRRLCLDECGERDRCYPTAGWRLSQEAHNTSLSGHFMLLFKLFLTPPLRRLWRFAQQRLLNGCCFCLLASQSKPTVFSRTLSAKKRKEMSLLFFY